MPLVASRQAVGCGSRQLTIDSSPLNTRTMLVVDLSQMKNEPSSEPATTYWPLLQCQMLLLLVVKTKILKKLHKNRDMVKKYLGVWILGVSINFGKCIFRLL